MKSFFQKITNVVLVFSLTLATSITQAQTAEDKLQSFTVQTSFVSGKRELSDEARFQLGSQMDMQKNLFRELLKARGINPDNGKIFVRRIVVKSRTDSRGSAEANLAISQQRSESLISDLQIIMPIHNMVVDGAELTPIGLGETESDENMCRQTEYLCTNEIKTKHYDLTVWMVDALIALGDVILPSSHAAGKSLFDQLFSEPEPEPRRVYQETPTMGNGDSNFGNDGYPQQEAPPVCEKTVWDEDCLTQQRISTIDVDLEFIANEDLPAQAPAVESPSVTTLPAITPATQPDVSNQNAPAAATPAASPTAAPVTPAPATTTPVAPKRVPKKLDVYGTEIN